MIQPTKAGPDTICACDHWYEEHNADGGCAGCEASKPYSMDSDEDVSHTFEFWPEYNTPEAIADRGGDPDKWPQWVKEFYGQRV